MPPRDPSMAGVATVGVLFFAVLAGGYVTWLGPLLHRFGMIPWRYAESFNNGMCRRVEGLDSCEKIIWHDASSTLYLACSTLESRLGWAPSLDHLDSSKRSARDGLYTYSPDTDAVSRIEIKNYPYPGMGISMHGLSVAPSSSDPEQLWVYAVNHRIPRDGGARAKGADSAIEVLSVRVGASEAQWVRTIEDGGNVVRTPNDVLGGPDGTWAYFTNEYAAKLGLSRVAARLGLPFGAGSIAFCHVDQGCKIAAPDVPGANGIARGKDGLIWAASSFSATIRAYEETARGTLKEVERIFLDQYMDDISVDSAGDILVATIPRATDFKHHFDSGGRGRSPTTVHRIYVNQTALQHPESAASKHAVDLLFADDGRDANGITSVEYDPKRRMLFLHGIISRHLSVCTF